MKEKDNEKKENQENSSEQPIETNWQKEYEFIQDKFVRLAAEMDNARKRWDRDRQDLIRFSEASLLLDILPVLDELTHALEAAKKHSQSSETIKGLEMVCANFKTILSKRGVKAVEAKGKKFDPHAHEIAASLPVGKEQDHFVLDELQTGYFLNDKVLRTAKVVVGVLNEQHQLVKEKKENGNNKNGETKNEGLGVA